MLSHVRIAFLSLGAAAASAGRRGLQEAPASFSQAWTDRAGPDHCRRRPASGRRPVRRAGRPAACRHAHHPRGAGDGQGRSAPGSVGQRNGCLRVRCAGARAGRAEVLAAGNGGGRRHRGGLPFPAVAGRGGRNLRRPVRPQLRRGSDVEGRGRPLHPGTGEVRGVLRGATTIPSTWSAISPPAGTSTGATGTSSRRRPMPATYSSRTSCATCWKRKTGRCCPACSMPSNGRPTGARPARKAEAPAFSPDRLTEGGRAVYELIHNRDPARVQGLMDATDPAVRNYLESLSLRTIVPRVEARLLIGHGDTDPLIPSTESLRLADALPDPEPGPRRHPESREPRGRKALGAIHPRVPDRRPCRPAAGSTA